MGDIYDLLEQLGCTAKYQGTHYMKMAVEMAAKNKNVLRCATKLLYPDIAQAFQTNWKCVERDMRTVITKCWCEKQHFLQELAPYPLVRRPTLKSFIGILANHLQPSEPDA